MTGVVHPEGCRCPGCLPAQYVMRQNRPAQYRPPTRRKPQQGAIDRYGIAGPLVLIGGFLLLIGFWPAMVWHGYGGPTGTDWRWDIHSTIAELVYFGAIGFIVLFCWLGKLSDRPPRSRPPKGRLQVEATPQPPLSSLPAEPQPPACLHGNAVPVNELDGPLREPGKLVAWLCPDCDTQLEPGFRPAELRPDASWPPARRKPS